MQINYNVTGARRKEMVKVISDTIGVKAEYKYMPTCNYEIGDFTVTKNGFLEFNDSVDSAKVKKVLEAVAAAGFSFKQQEKTKPEESEKTPNEAIIATKDEQDGETGLTIVLPLKDVEVENLNHILMAKETLIRHALGVDDLDFEIQEDKIIFPWFTEMPEPDKAEAYTKFIAHLGKFSKEIKRASSNEKTVENEKYAFRCFLLRLGYIGAEYKQDRKILLHNLTGNSSWKNGSPKKEEQE